MEYSIIPKQGVTLYFKIDSTQGIIRTNAALYTDQSRKYEVSLNNNEGLNGVYRLVILKYNKDPKKFVITV